VNMTAGLDLSIGEFEEMGDVVEEFASDNATVVVGTVLDTEMNDELRVTVIATGVGSVSKPQERPQMKVVPKPAEKTTKLADYKEFDKPTVARRQHPSKNEALDNQEQHEPQSEHYLDIPAFLRRQAD